MIAPLLASYASHVDGSLVVAVPVALLAGFVSFISPCVLPLVPGYLSFVTGLSAADLGVTRTAAASPRGSRLKALVAGRVMAGGLLFILGYSIVFVALGAAFGGVGAALRAHQVGITRIFGVVTIVLGLLFAGALSWLGRISAFEYRPSVAPALGMLGAPVLGMMFGLGWTPCIGPTLSAVLGLAVSTNGATAARGALLAFAYCLGLGVPFLVVGLGFQSSMRLLGAVKRHYPVVMGLGGALLVAIGVLEVTGTWTRLVADLQTHFSSSTALL